MVGLFLCMFVLKEENNMEKKLLNNMKFRIKLIDLENKLSWYIVVRNVYWRNFFVVFEIFKIDW